MQLKHAPFAGLDAPSCTSRSVRSLLGTASNRAFNDRPLLPFRAVADTDGGSAAPSMVGSKLDSVQHNCLLTLSLSARDIKLDKSRQV